MKYISIFTVVIMSGSLLMVSCSTDTSTHSTVRDAYAWLDTPVRASQQPARSADGITHWNAGLPTERAVQLASKNKQTTSKTAGKSRQQVQGASYDSYLIHPGYTTYYRGGRSHHRRYRGHRQPSPFDYNNQQSEQSRVSSVGPPLVPQGNIPLVDRSANVDRYPDGSVRRGDSRQSKRTWRYRR